MWESKRTSKHHCISKHFLHRAWFTACLQWNIIWKLVRRLWDFFKIQNPKPVAILIGPGRNGRFSVYYCNGKGIPAARLYQSAPTKMYNTYNYYAVSKLRANPGIVLGSFQSFLTPCTLAWLQAEVWGAPAGCRVGDKAGWYWFSKGSVARLWTGLCLFYVKDLFIIICIEWGIH